MIWKNRPVPKIIVQQKMSRFNWVSNKRLYFYTCLSICIEMRILLILQHFKQTFFHYMGVRPSVCLVCSSRPCMKIISVVVRYTIENVSMDIFKKIVSKFHMILSILLERSLGRSGISQFALLWLIFKG